MCEALSTCCCSAMADTRLQLLFEFQNSRRRVVTTKSRVCEALEQELQRFGFTSARVRYSGDCGSSNSYLLQRWSETWSNYIDVEEDDDLEDKDRVTVVPMTTFSADSEVPTRKITSKAQNIISRVKSPSQAAALASLFPTTRKRTETSFDPTAECIVLPQKKRKKAAIKSHNKPSTVTVVLLKEYSCIVPKGKRRQVLASRGRVKKLMLQRTMKPVEVKDAILGVFKDLHVSSFVVLDTVDSGHALVRAEEQDIDGEYAVNRRGCLYLCQKLESNVTVTSGSESDDSDIIRTSFDTSGNARTKKMSALLSKADNLLKALKEPVPLGDDSDVDGGQPVAAVDQQEDEQQKLEEIYVNDDEDCSREEDRARELDEWRQLREEQDRAYAECLQFDQEKHAEMSRREELLSFLREKWTKDKLSCCTGAKFCLRFSNSLKVECTLPQSASVVDLYEIAYAYGSLCKCWLYTVCPRKCVTHHLHVSDIPSPSVIVVEEDGEAPDPLDILPWQSVSSPNHDHSEGERDILQTVEEERERYSIDCLDTHQGLPHRIRRDSIFEDVIALYKDKGNEIFAEYPLRIKFEGEKAVDTGGVCRDMFSAFWDKAYERAFDGANSLIPAVHPHVDMALFPLLGAVFSHGFLSCGFMPMHLAFPAVAAVVLGTSLNIPESILVTSFEDFLSCHDRAIVREALNESHSKVLFSDDTVTKLISVFSQFSCRQRPTPQNLHGIIVQMARHEFLTKPLGALHGLHSGVPVDHLGFWNRFSIDRLFSLYNASKASPRQIIKQLIEPSVIDSNEQRVFSYLTNFIGNLSGTDLTAFLRFVTGSSSMMVKGIRVSFNTLTGIARRPISHTCSCELQLSTCYSTYVEFAEEFYSVLRSQDAWEMHAV